MAEWDAVSDLKRNGSKRESLQMEIDEMKQFMNENELGGSYGNILRLILDNAEQSDHPQGQKAAAGAQNGQKKSPQVILIDDDDDDADLPCPKVPLIRFHDEEAGGSNPVPKRTRPDLKSKTEKPRKCNNKDQKKKTPEIQIEEDSTSEKNKTLEIRIKIEGQKAAGINYNPVSKRAAPSQLTKTQKFPEVIMIQDDDEDED